MSNRIKIALLDTGVNALHPYLKDSIVKCYDIRCYGNNCEIILAEDMFNDYIGHGTSCASVIKKECSDVEIHSFKIWNQEGICNLMILEKTLSYIKQLDVDIINLSLAIRSNVDVSDLSKICNELIMDNKIIISALDNTKRKSYPALLSSCIGVEGFILNSIDSIWFNKLKRIQCVVDNTPYLHCNLNGEYSMFGKCNSFATAKLTGIVANIMSEGKIDSKKQVIDILRSKSKKKSWNRFDLKKSKRFPDIDEYSLIDPKIAEEIEYIVKDFIVKQNIHFSIREKFLFSSEIGLSYESCYPLIKKLEKYYCFKVREYTHISREDFYSINHIAHFINNQLYRKG